jgi:hypothetical protein
MAVNKLTYEGEHFYINKISSYTDLYLIRESIEFDQIVCRLGFKINFSGSEMKVERRIVIPHYQWNGTYSKFLWFFKVKNDVIVPAYEKAKESPRIFSLENYINKYGKEYKDFNKEYMKWVCGELDIEKDYEWVMEQYEFCKKTINDYFEVKKDEENTIKENDTN